MLATLAVSGAGATGVRDLMISSPSTGAANIANKVEQTFSQAVDLSNAVPVVPDFLKAAPPK
jgi:hypothetical protein